MDINIYDKYYFYLNKGFKTMKPYLHIILKIFAHTAHLVNSEHVTSLAVNKVL